MKTSLIDFNDTFLDKILSFLWQQWSALGVAGYEKSEIKWIIDPEALLLYSLFMCRYDARLFDEIIDWLCINGQFINVQRLTALQKKYQFAVEPQLSAVACYLSQKSTYQLKWKKTANSYKSARTSPFFRSKTGKIIPVGNNLDPIFLEKGLKRNPLQLRGYSQPFPKQGIASLLLRLRALIGVNARCEILCILSSLPEVHPSEAARLTGYFQKTIQTALIEMSYSGVILLHITRREKYYRLKPGVLDALLLPDNKASVLISWAPLLKGLTDIWEKISSLLDENDVLLISSELRRVMKKTKDLFYESRVPLQLISDDKEYPGEKYLEFFISYITSLLNYLTAGI